MSQYGFFFDQSRCTNCHACSVACRDWNDIAPGPVKWLRMLQWEQGAWPETRMHVLFATCYHCENPVCAEACNHNAIFKEEQFGAVIVDPDKCVGDRNCWQACPYGAPQFADDVPGTPMTKCTMCYDKLVAGELPVCVASCPQRALDFGPLDDMIARYGDLCALEGMPDGEVESPAIVFKPMTEHVKHVPYDAQEARKLMAQRGDSLPPIFDGPEDVTEGLDEVIANNKLIMKASCVAENLALSKNEDG